MINIKTCALLTAAALLQAACSSTALNPSAGGSAPAAAATSQSPTPAPAATQGPAPSPSLATTALPPHLDAKSAISTERSVYFDFDEFSIEPEYRALIERHGKYLAARPSLAIRIEGHSDERGGSEYNLALGQKRAEAVLRALRIAGASPADMEAVSFGEERPKATGHDEAAWSENRRADLQYPRK